MALTLSSHHDVTLKGFNMFVLNIYIYILESLLFPARVSSEISLAESYTFYRYRYTWFILVFMCIYFRPGIVQSTVKIKISRTWSLLMRSPELHSERDSATNYQSQTTQSL